jgi:hypothetical protein
VLTVRCHVAFQSVLLGLGSASTEPVACDRLPRVTLRSDDQLGPLPSVQTHGIPSFIPFPLNYKQLQGASFLVSQPSMAIVFLLKDTV